MFLIIQPILYFISSQFLVDPELGGEGKGPSKFYKMPFYRMKTVVSEADPGSTLRILSSNKVGALSLVFIKGILRLILLKVASVFLFFCLLL